MSSIQQRKSVRYVEIEVRMSDMPAESDRGFEWSGRDEFNVELSRPVSPDTLADVLCQMLRDALAAGERGTA